MSDTNERYRESLTTRCTAINDKLKWFYDNGASKVLYQCKFVRAEGEEFAIVPDEYTVTFTDSEGGRVEVNDDRLVNAVLDLAREDNNFPGRQYLYYKPVDSHLAYAPDDPEFPPLKAYVVSVRDLNDKKSLVLLDYNGAGSVHRLIDTVGEYTTIEPLAGGSGGPNDDKVVVTTQLARAHAHMLATGSTTPILLTIGCEFAVALKIGDTYKCFNFAGYGKHLTATITQKPSSSPSMLAIVPTNLSPDHYSSCMPSEVELDINMTKAIKHLNAVYGIGEAQETDFESQWAALQERNSKKRAREE